MIGCVIVLVLLKVLCSKIVGFVIIGEDVIIEDVYIGFFISIGWGIVICNVEIEYSLVDSGVVIENVQICLQDCLIGVKVQVCGGWIFFKIYKLMISDVSVVELV